MATILLTIVVVFVIIYLVPIVVYGAATRITDLAPPDDVSAVQFLLSLLVSKLGTAVALVLLFYFARASLSGQWLGYAIVWWLMFVLGEIGQALGPHYSWKEAIAGAVSETVYVPLSVYITNRLLGAA